MAGYFDIDPKIEENAERERRKELDYIKWTAKRGSGKAPYSLRLYSKYSSDERRTAREFLKDELLQLECQWVEEKTYWARWNIKRIFGVDAVVYDRLFYDPDLEDELLLRENHWHKTVDIIATAHKLTDAKIRATKETLDLLGLPQPKELQTAVYVREHYKKNQLRKAVRDALMVIFPQITEKNIIDKIAAKAL